MQTAHHRRALIETFESRILYSADPTPTGLAAAALAGIHQHLDSGDGVEQGSGVEIAFIDARLPDVQLLLDDLAAQQRAGRAIEVVLITADEDGIAAISATLAGRNDVSAVHVVGHGSDGVVELGSVQLDAGALLQRAGEISAWGDALGSNADLLLYGCDVAADAKGQSLVDALAQLTGADVAASDDLTGSALLGGDWTLEYTTGSIEATPFASAMLQANWGGLLSLTAQGGETLVNTTTAGSQGPMMGTKTVAMDANGNYVVVWQDTSGADGSADGIYAQRYNAAGTAQGVQFRVNTYTAGDQQWPEVAMDSSGDFVVVWQSQGQDGSNLGVYARRYNAAGTALDASEFRVNQTTNLDQAAPAIAADSSGNFVVTWVTRSQDAANTWGIYARRFAANGTALSNEFLVNTYTASDQEVPTIAMDSTGNFVIAWSSNGQDGSTFGIYAQRFDAAGTKQGGEFRVNSTTADAQAFPSIAMDRTGFVIVWQSNLQDGSDLGVYGQRYNASGATLGGEFRINTTVADAQTRVMVASTGAGGFLVTWNSNLQDGSLHGAYMRQYDSSGSALTGEVLVNTTTSGEQLYPSVAADANGHAVVVWGGNGFGDNDGMFMQRYTSAYPPVITLSGYSANYVENAAAIYDASATVTDDDSAVFNNGQLLYQITANGTATDELGIRNQGVSAGQIGISGSNVTYGGVIIGSYSGSFGNGSTPLSVSFNSNATVAAVQALVRNITYRDASENPSTATRTISLTISDGSGQTSTPSIVTMAVTAVNDPPVIGSNGGGATASVSVVENITAVTTVTSTDVDGGTATYSLSGSDAAKFSINSSGVLSFISAPNYEAPTDAGLNNVYDVTVQVSDGAGGSDTQAIAVTVTNVNEAPILNTTPAVTLNAQQEDSGAPSGAVGTLISSLVDYVDGAGWNNVTDEDSGASLGVAIVAANTTSGSWYYTINGGTNWSALGTVNTASARLLAADTLTRVYFVPNSNYNGTQSSAITIRAWDRSSGSNGSLADTATNGGFTAFSAATDTVSLTINAVNDEQSITINTGASFSEGSAGNVITAAMLTTSDVDNTAAQLTYTLTAIPTNGTLYRGGVALAGSASFTQADINAGLLTYTHNGSESTGDSFAFSVDDGAGSASSGSFTITINGVNDNAPVITSNGGGASASISVAENTIAVTTVSATDADIPSNTLTYSLSGGVDMNKFSIDASTGVLRFLTAPDFENPADNGGNNVYDLVVQVSDGSLTDTQTIAVTVTNVASELVVTTTADLKDGDTSSIGALVLNKGADGKISLREAIEAANNTAGADTITFNIADALVGGAHTINLVSMLPTITGTITIDGSTEPDWASSGGKPVLVINGGGTVRDGLQLYTGSDGSTIRGLVIQNFTEDGIDMASSGGHRIVGNRVGTSADGTTATPNNNGINLWASSGNQIGGSGVNDGNLLSGNYGPGLYVGGGSNNNVILGNLIGLDVTGTAALGNQWHGVYVIDSSNNQFGGSSAAERNVISGNGSNGLYIGGASSGNLVQGNYIGLDANGNNAIGNTDAGVMLSAGASGNTIGGATATARNLISGNTQYGVYLTGASTSDNLIRNNYIGVDAAGTAARSNGGFGVVVDALAANTTITDNLISGNTNTSWSSARGGIYLYADGVTIQGNTIGLGATGAVLGNGGGSGVTGGILSNSGSINVLIGGTVAGQGNVIAGNTGSGVVVQTSTSATRILGNSIYANTGLGIDLGPAGVTANDAGDGDTGANALQNYPVITAAFTSGAGQLYVSGSLNSVPNGYYRVEFFATASPDASGYGQGQRYLGFINVATDASGNASVGTTLSASVAVGEYLSATATQSASGYATLSYTSEFSAALAVADFNDPPVLTPSGAGVAYVENQPAVILDSGILVTDVDSANFAGGTLTASLVAMGSSSDILGIRNDGSGVGQIGLSGANVTYGGLVIGTRSGGTGGMPLVVSLNAAADVSAVQALMRKLSFSSSGDAISDNTRTVRLVLAEGDGTISNNVDVSVLVEAVNDAPVINLPATQTVAEDTTITFGSGTGNQVSIADADALLAPVRVTLSVGNGVLTLAGTTGLTFHTGDGTADGAMDITGTVADINAALDGMVFTPSSGFNGSASLQIDVSDQGNSGTGGALTASQPLVIEVTPVNDPPAFSFVSGNSNYPENAGPVVVAPSGTVSDVDSANFDGGRLVVYFSNNGQPEDRIAIQNEGVGAGQISINGSSVVVDGMVVGDWAGGTDGSTPLIISFNSNATPAIVQALTRNITYENISDAPSTAVRTMVGYVEDGDGGTSNVVSGTLTIIPSNDAPTIVSDGGGVSATVFVAENTTATTIVMATDPDSTGLVYSLNGGADEAAFRIDSVTGALRFVSAPDYESAADFNGDNVYEVIVQAADSNGAVTTQALFVTVTNINEAPLATITQPGYTASEQIPLVLAGTGMSIFDVDAGSAVIRATLDVTAGVLTASAGSTGVMVTGSGTASLTFEGSQSQINDLLAGKLGSSLAYLIDTDTPPPGDTLTLVVDDLGSSGSGSSASSAAAVMIDIVAVNDAPTATSLNTAQSYTEDTVLPITPIVVSDVDSANVTVTLTLSDLAAGSLNTGTSGAVTSSFGGGVWTASGAIADVNTLLANLSFTPSLNYNGDFTIATSVSDGSATVNGSKVLSGVAVNDAPTATNLNTAQSYTEDTALAITPIVVSDVDSASVTVTLTLSDTAAGSLNTATSGTVTSTFSGGVWAASGAIADVNTLLANLSFTPSLNYNGDFTIATAVSDGSATVNGSKALSGVAVNDAPTATNLNSVQSYTEDTVLPITTIVVSDVDSATVTVTLTLSNLAAGSLSVGTSGAVTSTFSGGVWTAIGAIADVNTLLASLSFTPSLDYNSDFTIATLVSDGSASVSGSKALSGVAVNDAPTATNLNTAQSYTEETALLITPIIVSDVDSASVTVTLTLSDIAAGSLNTGTAGSVTSTFNGGVWTASGAIADVNTLLASLSFTPALNYNGDFTIATAVSDGSSTLNGSKALSGVAVNDAPTATSLNTAQSYTEDTVLPITPIVVSDVDSANVTVTLTLSDLAAGSLNTGTSGAVTSSFGGGVWTASGAIADVNTLLANLSFTPSLNYNGDFTIATSVSDGSATVNGSKVLSGVAVNDAPTATNLNVAQSYTEDTALPITPIVVSDVDSATVTVTLTLSDTAAGSLTVGSSGAVTSTFAGGVWTVSGAIADVNTLLASLSFTPSLNYNSDFTIATSVSDGSASVSGSKALSGVAVNDAQTITTNTGANVVEGSSGNLLTSAMLTTSDVDTTASGLTYTLTAAPVHGALYRDGVVLMVGASFTQADINANLVTYTHDGSETTSDGFAFTVDDGIATASAGNFVIAIAAVNDNTPVITSPGSVSIAENTMPVLTVTATDADLPAQTLIYSIAGGADAGLFSIDPASGILRFASAPDFDIPGDADGNNIYDVVVRVSDGSLAGTQHLSISVHNRNEMPQGSDGRLVVAEDGTHVFAVSDFGFADVLDLSANHLAAVQIVSGPLKGVLSLAGLVVTDGQWIDAADIAAGLLTYAPAADENGTAYASLAFRVRDDGGQLDGGVDTEAGVHTLAIDVSPVNDVPAGHSDSYSLDEDTVFNVPAPGLLANDTDSDGDGLTATLVSGPAHGSLVLAADGSFRYTPSSNWSGIDSFSYRPFDGVAYGNSVVVSLVVGAVNDPPEIIHASFQVRGGGSMVLGADMIVASDVDSLPASIQFTVDRVENGHFEFGSAPGQAINQFSYADLVAGRVSFAHTILSDLPVILLHADDGQASGGTVSVKLSFAPTLNTGPTNPAPVVSTSPDTPPDVASTPATLPKPAQSATKPLAPLKPLTPIVLTDSGDGVVGNQIGSDATNLSNDNDRVRRHDGVDSLVRFGQAQIKLVLGANPEGPLMSFMLTGMDPATSMSSSAASRSLDSKPKLARLDDGAYADVRVMLQSVELTGVALSVGAVWWASRAGGLVASLLMAAPAWRTFDPLPVLGPEDEDDRDWGGDVDIEMARDEEGVADLFDQAREGMHS
jgi:CSLREA domain-containing protein